MKNVLILAENVLISLGLTASASAADTAIYKKNSRIGYDNINLISNKEMDYIKKNQVKSVS